MPSKLKYLSVCTYGHSRSVCLSRVLHERGQEAVDCGWKTAPSALVYLSGWADRILVICPYSKSIIPSQYQQKIIDFSDLGQDRWVNPYHKELHQILAGMVKDRLGIGLCQCNKPLYWTSPLCWHHENGVRCNNIVLV